MSNTPTDLIQALIDHADYQISTRNVTLSKQEEAVQKEKRRELMAAIVDALGLEPKAIQEKLGVNRTTWSRWESMESAPNKSHLQHLRRILEARHSNPPVPSPAKGLPQRPVDFLLKSPFTFSRIRLLFSVYPWKDAVLHFRKPFWDPDTAVDMASLALNGCRIIYIVNAAVLEGEDPWQKKFVRSLVGALGWKLSKQVLLSFCIVKDTEASFANSKDFGILNYLAQDAQEVGYIWNDPPSSEKPNDSSTNAYSVIARDDDAVSLLDDQYFHTLDFAHTLIGEQLAKGVREDGKVLTMTVLAAGTKSPEELTISY